MTATLIFALAWKSAACAGLTLLALRLLRSRSAAQRSVVAHLGLLACLLTPFVSLALPERLLAAIELPRPAASDSLVGSSAGALVATASAAQPSEPAAATIDLDALLPWLHGAPALMLVLALAAGVVRLQLLRSRAQVVVDPLWLTALATAQHRFGFKHGTALLVSRALPSPVSWGVLRPVVILDEESSADTGRAEAIVAHELAHLARLDWAKLLLGGLATALFWFNPLVWILARRCHELREEAADDAVLREGVAPTAYAELLVRCARSENRVLLAANGVSPGAGSLARRVGRVLDPSSPRASARAGWMMICCGAAAAAAAPLAAAALVFEDTLDPLVMIPRTAPPPPAGALRAGPAPLTSPRDAASSLASVVQAEAAVLVPEAAPPAAPERATPVQPPPEPPVPPAVPREVAPVLEEALVKAVERGDAPRVEQLLAAGVSSDAVVPGDGTPLIAAARHGRADMVRRLLAAGADINKGVDAEGTPLIVAAATGRLQLARMLLDAGADVEAVVWSDENALIQASMEGHADVVRLLIARGADVNARVGKRTPLRVARSRGHSEVERLLIEAGAVT